MESRNRRFIDEFKPEIEGLNSATSAELSLFDAGKGFESFNDYIRINPETNKSEAMEDAENGKGTTHIIWNYKNDGSREIVAYFTLSVNVVPYDDGIEEENFELSNFPSISVMEINMFAVSSSYQDVFYNEYDMSLPISAWCIQFIIAYANMICEKHISFQGLFLHAVPTAEAFYKTNGFSPLPAYTKPLYSLDQNLTAMWLILKEIHLPE